MDTIFSFDVFDTCLCRLCGESRLLFEVLSLKVQKEWEYNEHMRQMFVMARSEAYGSSLDEIYGNVAKSFPLPDSPKKMAQMEMETEKQLVAPIVSTRKLVDQLRKKGKIRYISDMYLPHSFIRERLVEHGFFRDGDELYVSDAVSGWKVDGSLFRYVHEKEKVSYRHWHHYGDNRHSDYVIPRQLGINAHHLYYDYLPYEEKWKTIPMLHCQWGRIFAGMARAIRLSTEAEEDQKVFVTNLSAPFMVAWVLDIMKKAHQQGVRRLYFCSRDMHTHFLVAKRLNVLFSDIEVRYLFISVKARQFDETLLSNYLIQEGVLSSEQVALVDSNSSGNTLVTINSIARRRHFCPILGYYITYYKSEESMSPRDEDWQKLNYLKFSPYCDCVNSTAADLLSHRVIVELLFSLNYHDRTIGYEVHGDLIRPILQSDGEDDWHMSGDIRMAKRQNDMMAIAFADAFISTCIYKFFKEILYQLSIPTLLDFYNRPTKKYLTYLHRFFVGSTPYVGCFFGNQKGIWKRGNLIFTLPDVLASFVLLVLNNKMVHKFHRKALKMIKRSKK